MDSGRDARRLSRSCEDLCDCAKVGRGLPYAPIH